MPLEYSNEEQAICAVGLVKPRPDVFAAAIQQLLVVCTTTEVSSKANSKSPSTLQTFGGKHIFLVAPSCIMLELA